MNSDFAWLTDAGPLGWAGFVVLVAGLLALAAWQIMRARQGRPVSTGVILAFFAAIVGTFFVLVGIDSGLLMRNIHVVGLGSVPWLVVVGGMVVIMTGALYLGYLYDKWRGKA